MTKTALMPMWDMMRLRYGIALRLFEALPADRMDEKPIAGMRSSKELFVHMCHFVRAAQQAVSTGSFGAGTTEAELVAGLRTREDVLAFARQCWSDADAAFSRITDAQLAAMVPMPWGEAYPGFVVASFPVDEFLHHRGQLYAFARALGVAPPMLWDFEGNAREFQPRAHADA